MRKIWFILALCMLALLTARDASALSTESRSDQNSDGTAKFSDPDEQKHAFMVTPDTSTGNNRSPSSGFSGVTMPMTGDNTPGAAAFNQAFAHQQH